MRLFNSISDAEIYISQMLLLFNITFQYFKALICA